MDTVGDSMDDDLNFKERCMWTENSKVYTRRSRKKVPNVSGVNKIAADGDPTTSKAPSVDSVQEHGEDTEKVCSLDDRLREQSSAQEQSVLASHEDDESALKKKQQHVEKGLKRQDPSIVDNHPTEDQVREANGGETAELGSHINLPLPETNDRNDIGQSSDRPCGEGASPLLSGNNSLFDGREPKEAQQPIGNGQKINEELLQTHIEVPAGDGPANVNGAVKRLLVSRIEDRIRFNLSKATPRSEIAELMKQLECELDQVGTLVKEVEASESQLTSLYNTQVSTNISNNSYMGTESANIGGYSQPPPHVHGDAVDRRLLVRMNSELSGVGHLEHRPKGLARVSSDVGSVRNLGQRSYNRQLTVSVMENNHMSGEFMEKEKRTPKANQYYRNSEFLLGKDRLPPESNKRLKTNNGKKYSGDTRHGAFGYGYDKSMKHVFKSCSSLLQRLMKHKFGWVFNEPVNAKALGLVDYHDVIKHPMDLGTIKTRLSQNWYKSPREFAEDVRLVFRNAMTYNPKGQDVHVMAEQMAEIFEERWSVIETECNSYWKFPMYQEAALPTPRSRKPVAQSYLVPVSVTASAPAPTYVTVPTVAPVASYPQRSHVGRTPVPKKPKAKDPNKRDMTFDEKQRLSTNLENLPPEKLDAIIQIIKKRNTSVSQNDDEIEVDIDKVDTETLWELDRFVTNYKKSLSKYKRKAELAMQARIANQNNAAMQQATPAPNTEVFIARGADFEDRVEPHDDRGQKPGENGSRSSSSSSSSSDSGSSSSDSDSDSSSADGSDPGHSPRT